MVCLHLFFIYHSCKISQTERKRRGGGGGGAGGYLDSSFLGIPAGTGFTGAAAVAGGRGAVLGRRLTGLYVITSLHAPCLSQYIAGTYAVPHILQTQ